MAIWTGNFARTLDDKRRLLLPKSVREILGDQRLYLTPGSQHCLELHTEESLSDQVRLLRETATKDLTTKAYIRVYYSQAQLCTADGQGRIRIPEALANWSGLQRDVAIVGTGHCMEIWDGARWREFLEVHQGQFDEVCQQLELCLRTITDFTNGHRVKPVMGGSGVLDDTRLQKCLNQ